MDLLIGILIPFFGTTFGSAMVFFMKKNINNKIEKLLLGFASGVMIAASIWSLLIPSIDMSNNLKIPKWLPSSLGFLSGVLFLIVIDKFISNMQIFEKKFKKNKINFYKTLMMIFSVTLHNIPEGMAVGIIFAGVISNNSLIAISSAFALSIGIAIQNFPEGAIISMPLKSNGFSKKKSFILGMLSGIVEPISAFITILLTNIIIQILPYLLSFASGAMIYVVVEDLIPTSQNSNNSKLSTIGITFGFLLMMILDVSLG